MSASVVVDLLAEANWDPGRITAKRLEWPVDYPLVALGEVASVLYPDVVAPEGALVITPGGLDPSSGGVRRRSGKYLGAVFQVGSGDGLRVGDLLVPPTPQVPVLYVTDALQGSLVAGSFTALRIGQGSSWLWAVLNSAAGKQQRAAAMTGNTVARVSRASLLELRVPWAPPAQQRSLAPALKSFIAHTVGDEEEAPTSWWRTADIRSTDWRLALATPRPELFEKGFPLSDLIVDMRRGRSDTTIPLRDDYHSGDVPVADARWLRTGKLQRWCPPESSRVGTLTREADVVMATFGTSAHAAVAPSGMVIDTSVIAVTLADPSLARGLATYLNSRTGRGMRGLRLSGSTMPQLNIRDARELRVTVRVFDPVEATLAAPMMPLEERLEQVLWN